MDLDTRHIVLGRRIAQILQADRGRADKDDVAGELFRRHLAHHHVLRGDKARVAMAAVVERHPPFAVRVDIDSTDPNPSDAGFRPERQHPLGTGPAHKIGRWRPLLRHADRLDGQSRIQVLVALAGEAEQHRHVSDDRTLDAGGNAAVALCRLLQNVEGADRSRLLRDELGDEARHGLRVCFSGVVRHAPHAARRAGLSLGVEGKPCDHRRFGQRFAQDLIVVRQRFHHAAHVGVAHFLG